MLYQGDLIVREIPYGKRKIKWSYDVISDSSNTWDLNRPMVSRVLLRYLLSGNKVTFVDDNNQVLHMLGQIKQ